ncbi:hypothetical protein ACWFMI_23250 [Nocardiopsis terrae]|uniref:hypothetical protein n=1 Tax=Streptomyces sp. NPDC057554 TaxID=3350538 RepID=UPI00368B2E5A
MKNTNRNDALIVGSGHSGLALAMGLAQDGWRVEMTTRHSLGELLGGPARITQPSMPSARAAERDLGLDVWSHSAPQVDLVEMILADPEGESTTITTRLPGLATAVDRRLASALWIQALERHGVVPLVQHSQAYELEYLLPRRPYDLVALAPGAHSDLSSVFAIDSERTQGASRRVITQAHVETDDWGEAEPRIILLSTPEVEVLITPVLAYDQLPQDQVLALSSEDPATAARNLKIDPYWAACVQVIARPGTSFAPTPLPKEQRVRPQEVFNLAWAEVMAALAQVAPELAARYRDAPQVPGSGLVQHLHPQVRHPVAHLGKVPVLGIGDVTMTVDPATGQGAAVSTLVATTLRSQIRDHLAPPAGELDTQFLAGAWAAFDTAHGQHANTFGAFVNAYWNRFDPVHAQVRAMVAALKQAPEQAAAWGAGIDQPALMANVLTPS